MESEPADVEPMVQRVGFWIFVALIGLICTLGILGNILSLLVLLQPRMRNSTSIILVGLVISDLCVLVPGLIINSIGLIFLRCYFEMSQGIDVAAVVVFRVFFPLKKIGKFVLLLVAKKDIFF